MIFSNLSLSLRGRYPIGDSPVFPPPPDQPDPDPDSGMGGDFDGLRFTTGFSAGFLGGLGSPQRSN